MTQIAIYKAEADLAQQIRANSRISYASVLESASVQKDLPPRTQAAIKRQAKATNLNQIDLHYLKTVLASTVWNRNDDVFDPIETWIARATPEDKPFNYEHDASDIIGHITSTHVVDGEGKTVDDSTPAEELPNLFHVVTGAVLYKYWPQEELQDRMDAILAEIAQGNWYVSMECLFTNFDYCLKDSQGNCRVIARNGETAFLTKHLRAYGGSGVYKDQAIGRVLRNIVFSGKGLVRRPANPDSLVFQDFEEISFASFSQDLNAGGYMSLTPDSENLSAPNKTEHEMTQATATADAALQKEIEQLRAENKELRDNDIKQLTEAKAEVEAKLEEAKAQLVKLEADNKTAQEKSEQDLAEATAKVEELTKQLETEKASAKDLGEQLENIKAEKEGERRLRVVSEKLELSGDEAAEFLKSMASLPAEAFDAQVEFLAQAVAKSTSAPTAPKSTPAQDPPKSTPAEAPLKSKASQDPEDNPAEVIENAEPNEDPALNVTDADDKVQGTRRAIAAFFGCEDEE